VFIVEPDRANRISPIPMLQRSSTFRPGQREFLIRRDSCRKSRRRTLIASFSICLICFYY